MFTRSAWSPWPPFPVSLWQDVLATLVFCVLGASSQIPPTSWFNHSPVFGSIFPLSKSCWCSVGKASCSLVLLSSFWSSLVWAGLFRPHENLEVLRNLGDTKTPE